MKNTLLWVVLGVAGLFFLLQRKPTPPRPVTQTQGTATEQNWLSDLFSKIPITSKAQDNTAAYVGAATTATKSIAETLAAIFGGGGKKSPSISIGSSGAAGGGSNPQRQTSSTQQTSAPVEPAYSDISGTYDTGDAVTSEDLPYSDSYDYFPNYDTSPYDWGTSDWGYA